MMNILHERKLSLSTKKTKIGRVEDGFHFLGINYPGTRTQDNTTEGAINDAEATQSLAMNIIGGAPDIIQRDLDVIEKPLKREPHARTFRKARENVKFMIDEATIFRYFIVLSDLIEHASDVASIRCQKYS